MKIAGKILKWFFHALCLVVVFGTIGLSLWRIFMLGTPNEMKGVQPNETLRKAYWENGEKLTVFYQEQNSLTRAEENAGYFGAIEVCFIEEADQLQVVFRHNVSTLKHLKEDYSLAEVPSRSENHFDVTVVVGTDLTPDNKEDNNGNDPACVSMVRYYPSSCTEYQNSLYNYYKLTFDGVSIDDLTLVVYMDVYYKGDVNYDKKPYGTLCLYDYGLKRIERKLSDSNLSAIATFEN